VSLNSPLFGKNELSEAYLEKLLLLDESVSELGIENALQAMHEERVTESINFIRCKNAN
jgi:hypothetical protein